VTSKEPGNLLELERTATLKEKQHDEHSSKPLADRRALHRVAPLTRSGASEHAAPAQD
jgi:hypothetical protein